MGVAPGGERQQRGGEGAPRTDMWGLPIRGSGGSGEGRGSRRKNATPSGVFAAPGGGQGQSRKKRKKGGGGGNATAAFVRKKRK
ncbi:hypothetical protein IDH41_19575 [Paenibacillus sp. IB182493]|uniref:Uncharacterized protein n=1 Tax=Paenibacillus arenilitoris TaxID=2772299 RepID=A0A927CNG7_9BACL|nr:hypothetical protein [Paenibacillus arenilitoris]